MKTIIGLALCTALITGCSDPKSLVLPTDLNNVNEDFKDQIADLSEEDKSQLMAYMMRVEMGKAFGGEGIPPGTTVGEAIEDNKNWAAALEAEENESERLAAEEKAKRDIAKAAFDKALTAAVVDKGTSSDEYGFSHYITLTMAFENKSSKKISGLKGSFTFFDSFGEELTKYLLSEDEFDIEPGATKTVTQKFSVNEFINESVKVYELPLSKLKWEFEGDTILFADGSKLAQPE